MSGTVYKIRNRNTGLFSPGGVDADTAKWTPNGKVWSSMGALKNHLRQFVRRKWPSGNEVNLIPDHWEVIPIEVVHNPGTAIQANTLIKVRGAA